MEVNFAWDEEDFNDLFEDFDDEEIEFSDDELEEEIEFDEVELLLYTDEDDEE